MHAQQEAQLSQWVAHSHGAYCTYAGIINLPWLRPFYTLSSSTSHMKLSSFICFCKTYVVTMYTVSYRFKRYIVLKVFPAVSETRLFQIGALTSMGGGGLGRTVNLIHFEMFRLHWLFKVVNILTFVFWTCMNYSAAVSRWHLGYIMVCHNELSITVQPRFHPVY